MRLRKTPFAWLVDKEWRELLASRAWWVMLALIGPLVGVYPAARSHRPPWTAAMKLMIHVPTVTLSVTIAAVDG